MSETQIIKHEDQDSIEISTPARGGAIKVYGSFGDPETFRKKMINAFVLREEARRFLEESEKPK